VAGSWWLAAVPWTVGAALCWWRSRWNAPPVASPIPADELVSVIVPARNEARNIEGCMRAILASGWTNLELIVVNDHSTDGTGDIARRVAAEDPRARVIENPDLPAGWFGKQWACHNGQLAAGGRQLVFTDADTRHGPEIISRCIHSLRERGAHMVSVMPTQDYGTFWERLMMPHVISLIMIRYGDVERMNASKNPWNKIANGQFILVTREWYDRMGGHEGVRSFVGEDLMLAQAVARAGGTMHILDGRDHIRTRMYEGLGELMRGWGKNVYAAGRDTLPLGPAAQEAIRFLLPLPPLIIAVIPFLAIFAGGAFTAWGLACYLSWLAWWITVYREHEVPLWYALLHPLAAFMLFVLMARATWRGMKVEWKGREYVSGAS
jgi:chlorobactene glucosyltransferase